MANGHTESVLAFEDMGAKVGILAQRVQTIESSLSGISSSISSLASKLEDRNRPQWGLLVSLASFILLFVSSVGFLAYAPISKGQSDLQTTLTKAVEAQAAILDVLRTNYIPRDELDWRGQRAKEDRERTDRAIVDLNANVFPREVHIQRWARFDSDIAATRHDMDVQVANLQRQIEALQRQQGDTYTARDALLDVKRQVEQLQNEIRTVPERKYP
jgi:prefoldin subunit 5